MSSYCRLTWTEDGRPISAWLIVSDKTLSDPTGRVPLNIMKETARTFHLKLIEESHD